MTALILVLIVAQPSAITLDAELAKLNERYDPYVKMDEIASVQTGNGLMAAELIGEQLGITTYDFQQNGAMGNRIAVDPDGNVHISWMRSIDDPPFATRDVYYNYSEGSGFVWTDGVEASGIPRAGYTTCGALPTGEVVVAFHHDPDGDGVYESAVSVDAAPGAGAFGSPVSIDPTTVPEQPIWPHVAVDTDGVIHVIARIYWDGNGTQPANLFNLYYSRSEDNGVTFSEWETIATDCISDAAIATSADGGDVLVAWTAGVPVEGSPDVLAVFGHIKYIESSNGGQSWGSETNITKDRYPQGPGYTEEVPDEDQAYRMFANAGEIDCAYDNSNNIQILFCDGLHYYYDEGSWFNYAFYGRVNHWNESNGFSIPSGPEPVVWTDDESLDSLALWGINFRTLEGHNGAYTPQIAIWGDSIAAFWGGQRDTLDLSGASAVNGDIYAAGSPDNGANWKPIAMNGLSFEANEYYANITNTHSYGAGPDECNDEDYISVWPWATGDVIHLTYIHDLFAGSVVDNDGPFAGIATDNPVAYLGYPVVYVTAIEEDEPSTVTPELMVSGLVSVPVNVSLSVPLAEPGVLTIRNVLGQTVSSYDIPQGFSSLIWNGIDLNGHAVPAGMYFLEVKTESFRGQGKVTLVR